MFMPMFIPIPMPIPIFMPMPMPMPMPLNCGWLMVAPIRIIGLLGVVEVEVGVAVELACCCCSVRLVKGRAPVVALGMGGNVASIRVTVKGRPPKSVPVKWVAVTATSLS